MAKFNGTFSTSNQMKLFRFFNWNSFEKIIEGPMAHDYTDAEARKEIRNAYNKRHRPPMTPLTHPAEYDPFSPPAGWAYDPYYEIWIQINE